MSGGGDAGQWTIINFKIFVCSVCERKILLGHCCDFYHCTHDVEKCTLISGFIILNVGFMLLFGTSQLKKCQQGVLSSVASSQAAAVSDGTTTPNSFFARFSF